ncbi:MAG: DNA-binding protein WhiA, partial [Bacillota bacterium]|nr:DNA-binding protein WhiA [Bacillota bacterium]
MSFSSDVKTEACKTGITRSCCATAEVYGLMLYATAFSCREIRITTSNPALIKRMPTLLTKALKIEMPAFATSAKTTFQLTDKSALGKVFTAFGYEFKDTALHLNRAIIDDECCISSFLRGVFLSGGAVMNPDKKYHLEFSTNHLTLNRE